MDEERFGLELIVAEEQRRQDPVQTEDEVNEPLVIDRRDFTTADAFSIHEPGTTFPIEGPGTLIDLLIIADSDQFDVYVEVDGRKMVGESFTSLQDDTVELARISAYERVGDDNYVFNLTELDFRHQIRASITPQEEITFLRQRADLDLS